jgi:ubiquinone/menaquinone biosynthesis C-methylase UbiE
MSFYQTHILPWLLDLAMRQRQLVPYRERVLAEASGRVLEIGVGSGPNLPLYGSTVALICAIDPSPELLQLARRRTAEAVSPVSFVRASAEKLPFAGGVFDTVVTSWTLCSIPEPLQALREMRRVLTPAGRLLFVEHGLAPESGVARWQHWLTPYWRRIAGGCHLDRNIEALIRSVGFHIDRLDKGYINGPKVMTYMYEGQARPAHAPSPAPKPASVGRS